MVEACRSPTQIEDTIFNVTTNVGLYFIQQYISLAVLVCNGWHPPPAYLNGSHNVCLPRQVFHPESLMIPA